MPLNSIGNELLSLCDVTNSSMQIKRFTIAQYQLMNFFIFYICVVKLVAVADEKLSTV